MIKPELHHLIEFEFCDKNGNRVHKYANGDFVTYDMDGNPIKYSKVRPDGRSGWKPSDYRTPEDRMREIETRMAGIESRLERLENDGR